MGDDLRDRYIECKNLTEKDDLKKFDIQFSIFNEQSNDEIFQKILINNLIEKLKAKCNQIKLDATEIKQFESDRISSLNENFTKIKLAFEMCKDLIPIDNLNEEKALIQTEISKIVKKIFFSYIECKKSLLNSTDFEFDENFRESLNSLIGFNVFDEIYNQVLSVLNDLSVDGQLAKDITDSILQNGMNEALKFSKDDIPPEDYEKFKEKIRLIFKTNRTPYKFISNVLKELKITENDGMHQRIIDSVLSEGVNSLNSFRESISKNNFNKLIENYTLKIGTGKLGDKFKNEISKKKQSELETKLSWIFKNDKEEINNDFCLQLFKTKKMEAFNIEIGMLRQATELLKARLTTWNLPAAIEDVGAKSIIPQSLIEKSQMIKQKGGIARIDSMLAELPPLLQRNTEILNQTKRSLEDEERLDSELKSQMKEKWSRTASAHLTKYLHSEIRQFESIIQNSIKANKLIEEKYTKNRDGIQLLSKPAHEISSSFPVTTSDVVLRNTYIIKDMRRLMDEVEAVRNVREVLESEMKCIDSDALTAKLITALSILQGLDEQSIIQAELDELVGPMRKRVRENIQEQEKLLSNIEKANGEFSREKVHNETSKIREQMLRNLAIASDSYIELDSNLVEGVKFYNDLTPILIKFQSKVNDFVFARKKEADDLMKEI
ncbi:programmed cell death 6-interacting -like [Brachionus plicatilis]|uniref:Programmed cell death 6-interacting-like n=1 Tax=Brachionus plicatilis TaxID=10195 RepID=A0A3M7Q778_BRAPC|nr:programmed cell death 6-interacting -like [Brachionus plicatilis]